MPTLVSTGQITITDNNDAKPITAFIVGNQVLQQIYTRDDTAETYTPSRVTDPLVLTAKVFVGGGAGATNIVANTALFTNKHWSYDAPYSDGGSSIGTGSTLTINTNDLSPTTPNKTVFFEGDYTDPYTTLVSHIIAQVAISLVKTGTNAVYIQVSGKPIIKQATGATKNFIKMTADLMRSDGPDDDSTTYQWYEVSESGVKTQIFWGNIVNLTSKYGFLDTSATLDITNSPGSIGGIKASGNTVAISSENLGSGFRDLKTIVIDESAVNSTQKYLVKAKSNDNLVYQAFFTVYDVSDTYKTDIISTSGEKLQNGIGSTDMYPHVYTGSSRVTDLTGWTFDWTAYDKDGLRSALVDTSTAVPATGLDITANTSTVFTATGGSAPTHFVVGQLLKAVKPDGNAFFYQVSATTYSAGTSTVTIVPTATGNNAYLNGQANSASISNSAFAGGKLYAALASKTTNGGSSQTAAKITVTGYDVDFKGNYRCASNRP